MRITALEEYGLRTALVLARQYGQRPLSASKIAESEGISNEYASKILYLLRSGGIISAERGTQGGFRLVNEPAQVDLKQIFDSIAQKRDIDETVENSWCSHFSGTQSECVHTQDCSVRPVWSLLSGFFDDVLKRVTLADLLERESVAREKIERIASHQADLLSARIKPVPALAASSGDSLFASPVGAQS